MAYLTPPANFYRDPGVEYDVPIKEYSEHVGLYNSADTLVTEISTDPTMALNSDEVVPTQKAIRTFIGASPPIWLTVPLILQSNTPYQLELQQLGQPGHTTFGHTATDSTEIADANGVHFMAGTTVFIDDATDATSLTVGAATVAGGLAVAKKVYAQSATLETDGAHLNMIYASDPTKWARMSVNVAGNFIVNTSSGWMLTDSVTKFWVSNTTDSTSLVTGSFITSGGIGCAKRLWAQAITVEGTATQLTLNYDATHTGTVAADVNGYLNLGASATYVQVNAANRLAVMNVSSSDSIGNTSAIYTPGGISCAKSMVGRRVFAYGSTTPQMMVQYDVTNATSLSTSATGVFTIDASGNEVNIAATDVFRVLNVTDATTPTDVAAACQIAGGLAVAKKLYAGDDIHANVTTSSTSVSTGSGVFNGGIGVAGAIFMGGILTQANAQSKISITSGTVANTGTQSIAIGYNTCPNSCGSYTIAIGSDAVTQGNNLTDGIAIGREALKMTNGNSSYDVAIGYQALTSMTQASNNIGIGNGAGRAITTGSTNIAIGTQACYDTATAMTVASCIAIGADAMFGGSGAAYNYCLGDGSMYSRPTGGRNIAMGYHSGYYLGSGGYNTFFGNETGYLTTTGIGNTGVGSGAAYNVTTGSGCVAVGDGAMAHTTMTTTVDYCVAVGKSALYDGADSMGQTAIGYRAMYGRPTGALNTAVGYQAGIQVTQAYANTTCLGANSAVAGANEVQLGDAATTTYAYGAVQDRSDLRDKTAIRPTVLGLDFVMKLNPVDFKWDMRDDYRSPANANTGPSGQGYRSQGSAKTPESQDLTTLVHDGTHTRTRFHHGFIAQDIAQVITETGLDFGGYQDHTVKGGQDVKTLGYSELIAPMVKAIQQLAEQVSVLTQRIAQLEGRT